MSEAAPASGSVDLRAEGPIGVITLDRPQKLNALTPEMLDQLERVVAMIDADPDMRVVVVESAGDRAFCAGADIERFAQLDSVGMWATWTRRGHQVLDRLATLRQPTIAAIDGHAYGGGLELALACDLRVLAAEATLGLTEVGLGTVPGWGGTHRLPRQIGVTRAKEAVLTGAPITADRALAWGLVNSVVPAAEVRRVAHELAVTVARQAPVAVQMSKQAIDVAAGQQHAMPLEGLASAASASTPDFGEGLAAFTQRRGPVFQGLAAHRRSEGHDE